MKCILVRHGQTDWNSSRMTQGQSDTPLNETGILQAKRVARALENENINKCYYSPLKRAKATAEEIINYLNIVSEEDKSLIEFNFGLWEGRTLEEISIQYKDEFYNWMYAPQNLTIPEGEEMKNALNRARAFSEKRIMHSQENILIVSHGLLIKILIISILGLELKDLQKFRVDNASISVIEIRGERRYLSRLNDTYHLEKI